MKERREGSLGWGMVSCRISDTLSTVIPGCAGRRRPGIHWAAEADREMDSGLALRAPRNDDECYFTADSDRTASPGLSSNRRNRPAASPTLRHAGSPAAGIASRT